MATERAFRVLDRGAAETVVVDREEYDTLAVRPPEVPLLEGFTLTAEVRWGDTPELTDVAVTGRTLLEFVDGATNLFEVAIDTWEEARDEGVGVNSRVTYSTDGDPNGALYTFADGPGSSVFREFQSGGRPLEPLLERVDRQPPHEVFVLRPATRPFVLVYIVFEKDSVLADTVRETYGCPRPTDPADG